MLSSTQFVENRVEEFEEFSASLSTNSSNIVIPKSKAEREAELMSKMKQAIQLGLSACNSKRYFHPYHSYISCAHLLNLRCKEERSKIDRI